MAGNHQRMPRRPTRRQLLSLARVSGTIAAVAATGLNAESVLAQANDPLVGSWMSIFHRSTGEVLSGLLTFHADGTVINATSDQLTGSPSHGHWRSLGSGQYSYSVMRLNVDADGNFAGFRAIDADVTLDPTGASWTSVSRTNYYDPTGTFVRTLTSTVAASRIPLLLRTDPIAPTVLPSQGSSQR